MAQDTIFSKIVAGEIPADVVAESERVLAFRDVSPQAPVHVVIIPKTNAYENVTELAAGDPALLAEMVAVANRIASDLGEPDFRLLFNNGAGAGQTVFHVHAHLLAGSLGEKSLVGS